jgi:alpha-tubulin suppressor-like RCC1 family protein
VYSWGNGANYQLGSGAVGLQPAPARLDTLHGMPLVQLAAAKFHSAALAADGSLYTWGFGRGGRLGARARRHAIANLGKRVLLWRHNRC